MVDAERIKKAVVELLSAIGEDPNREELLATPEKVATAYAGFFAGVGIDPEDVLNETFPAEHTDVVILKDIELVSICEHHLLPFTGVAHIAYLPSDRVIGLGRLPKLVEVLSARPQLQENLTAQIADALEQGLNTKGVVVVIEARHHCVASRGARQPEANTLTMASRGVYGSEGMGEPEGGDMGAAPMPGAEDGSAPMPGAELGGELPEPELNDLDDGFAGADSAAGGEEELGRERR